MYWNKLICEKVDKCSVNFSWENSLWENKKEFKYFWYLNWKKFFEWINPKTIYLNTWKYDIKLEVINKNWQKQEDYFYVFVTWKNYIWDFRVDKNIFWNLIISWVLPNNSWKDDREFIEIENIWNKTLNLRWLIIKDNSKKFEIKNDYFLYPYSKKRFYKRITKLSLWNKKDSVSLYYNNKLLDKIEWNFLVPDDFLLTHSNIWLSLEKVFVERVIDWDTIKVRFKNNRFWIVRLLWVDTPETKDPRKKVEFFWKQASLFTKNKLEKRFVYLEYDKTNLTWKYWRILAYVFLDNNKKINFNKILVEKWYARVFLKYPFKYEKEFLIAEKNARKKKLWIWSNKELKKELLKQIKEEKEILKKIKNNKIFWKNLFLLNYINTKNNFFDIWDKIFFIDKKIKDRIIYWFDFEKHWKRKSKKNLYKTKKYNKNYFLNKKTKKLSKSIKYRVYKNKKFFKISWYSSIYRKLIIDFEGKKYKVFVNKNKKFTLKLRKVNPWKVYINFYWIWEKNDLVFLRKSRVINISKKYAKNIWKIKKYWRKKKIEKKFNKNNKNIKNKIFDTVKNINNYKKYYFNKNWFILFFLISLLSVLFWYLILEKKWLLLEKE